LRNPLHHADTPCRRRTYALIFAASTAASLIPTTVLGANKTYIGAAGGDWNTSLDWSPAGVPAAGDWAFFQPTGSNSYTYDGNYSTGSPLGSLTLGNGTNSTPALRACVRSALSPVPADEASD
jgi:hypothetical protein